MGPARLAGPNKSGNPETEPVVVFGRRSMSRHSFARTSTVAFVPALLLVLAGCGTPTTVSPPASVGPCPVTPYVSGRPSDRNTASFTTTWFGNDALWAGLHRSYGGCRRGGGAA